MNPMDRYLFASYELNTKKIYYLNLFDEYIYPYNLPEAIQKKYGQYGHLFNSAEDMLKFFNKLTIEMLASLNTDWHENLLKIQQRRHPINLGKEFAKLPH